METQKGCVGKVFVDEEMYVMGLVVDESERGDTAREQPEVFFHSGFGGKTQLALMQTVLQIVDVHLMAALEDDEIVLVSLVVSEKQVLAMGGVELLPVTDGFLDGWDGRMEIDVECNAKAFQSVDDFLLTLAQRMCDFGRFHVLKNVCKCTNFVLLRLIFGNDE